jgi:hypothetical protein
LGFPKEEIVTGDRERSMDSDQSSVCWKNKSYGMAVVIRNEDRKDKDVKNQFLPSSFALFRCTAVGGYYDRRGESQRDDDLQSPKAQVTRNLGTDRWYNIIPFLFYLTRSVSLLSSCIGHQGLHKHKNISKKKITNKQKMSPHH